MQTSAWRCSDSTGSGIVPRPGTAGVAAAVAFAFLAGTGGVTGPSYFVHREDRGYAFVHLQPAARPLAGEFRTPQEDVAHIRAVFRPSIADIANIFNVSRQSIYNWMSGERPSQESIDRLGDLAKAADLFLAHGIESSTYLVRRKLDNGKTLMESVRDGESAQDAARSLIQMAQKEMAQREALQRRLGTRTAPRELSDMGSPMLNEDLG